MSWDLGAVNDPEYKAIESGWKRFVEQNKQPDVYWDPVDRRWETYSAAQFIMARSTVPSVKLEQFIQFSMFAEVHRLSAAVRALGGRVVWNPRDGYWYSFGDRPVVSPDWMERMNKELKAIDQNPNLSPEEKQRARLSIIDSYTPGELRRQ